MKKFILILLMFCMMISISNAYTLKTTVGTCRLIAYLNEGDKVSITYNDMPGYSFSTWTPTGSTVYDNSSRSQVIVMPANNVVMAANRTTESYTISYVLDGGNATNPKSYTVKSKDITLKQPTKDGCTFEGWIGSNGNVPQKTVTIPKGSTGNKSYTAVWSGEEYTVTVDKGTGGTVTPGTTGANYGDSLTFAISANTGYKIKSIKLDDVAQSVSNVSSMNITVDNITSNKTLQVRFETISYTISYNLDGGTVSGTNPTSYTVASNTITLINPTKSGYTFAGWIGSNGNTPQTTLTITTGNTGDKTYTATWTTSDPVIVFTWDTTGQLEKTIYVGASSATTVDWGDGTTSPVPASDGLTTRTHTYSNSGNYTVKFYENVIQKLECSSQHISSLDVTKATNLVLLRCSRNELTSLDVTKNSALYELFCNTNSFTSLNVSKCTRLTKLECVCNELVLLDVSNNLLLTKLSTKSTSIVILDSTQTALKSSITNKTITITQTSGGEIKYARDLTFTITPNLTYSVQTLTVGGVSQTPATSYTFPSLTADSTITATFSSKTIPGGNMGGGDYIIPVQPRDPEEQI